MREVFLGAAAAALCLLAAPSFAASAETEAFVANVRLNAVFLGRSSELAADRSDNTGLQTFASSEAAGQSAVVVALDKRNAPAVAPAEPITVAANEVVTGRSAAEGPTPTGLTFTAPIGTGALMPAAMITLDHLAASKGQAFDSLYKTTQINALRQLAGLYNAYSMTGDDPVLRQMSKDELTTTNARIADLARF